MNCVYPTNCARKTLKTRKNAKILILLWLNLFRDLPQTTSRNIKLDNKNSVAQYKWKFDGSWCDSVQLITIVRFAYVSAVR